MSITLSIPEQFWPALNEIPKYWLPMEAFYWPELNPNAISTTELPRLLALASFMASEYKTRGDDFPAGDHVQMAGDSWGLALWVIQELELLQREAVA